MNLARERILLQSNYQISTAIVKSEYWVPAGFLAPVIGFIWKLMGFLPADGLIGLIERYEYKFRTEALDDWEKTVDLVVLGEPFDPREIQLQRTFDKTSIATMPIV